MNLRSKQNFGFYMVPLLFSTLFSYASIGGIETNGISNIGVSQDSVFHSKEPLYVLNGKVLGNGKDKLKNINTSLIKDLEIITDVEVIKRYGGNPEKDIVNSYVTFKSAEEKAAYKKNNGLGVWKKK